MEFELKKSIRGNLWKTPDVSDEVFRSDLQEKDIFKFYLLLKSYVLDLKTENESSNQTSRFEGPNIQLWCRSDPSLDVDMMFLCLPST